MMKMIAGTVKNAVKLNMLTTDWEQKKNTNNIFTRKDRNERANMTSEQKMLDQFKNELAKNREQSKNNGIANKIMNGEDLTPEEERYLAQNNPGQLSNYRRMQAERKAYEDKLKKCKTKDEVQRLKTNTMNGYLAELKSAPGEAKAAKAMEILGKVRNVLKAELHFVESGEYAKLPTEADEAIEREKEWEKENEDILETLKESAETDDENAKVQDDERSEVLNDEAFESVKADHKAMKDEGIRSDEETKKKTEVKSKKKEKDPIEEIERICRPYMKSVDRKTGEKKAESVSEADMKKVKSGNIIDITL